MKNRCILFFFLLHGFSFADTKNALDISELLIEAGSNDLTTFATAGGVIVTSGGQSSTAAQSIRVNYYTGSSGCTGFISGNVYDISSGSFTFNSGKTYYLNASSAWTIGRVKFSISEANMETAQSISVQTYKSTSGGGGTVFAGGTPCLTSVTCTGGETNTCTGSTTTSHDLN